MPACALARLGASNAIENDSVILAGKAWPPNILFLEHVLKRICGTISLTPHYLTIERVPCITPPRPRPARPAVEDFFLKAAQATVRDVARLIVLKAASHNEWAGLGPGAEPPAELLKRCEDYLGTLSKLVHGGRGERRESCEARSFVYRGCLG